MATSIAPASYPIHASYLPVMYHQAVVFGGVRRCGRLGTFDEAPPYYLPTSESTATAEPFSLVWRRPCSVGAPFFLRLFGGHDPKFRLILHLFHYRYGTILPSSVPGSGYHLRADHPLSVSHPPCRSYDADNPSIATSLVPDSTIRRYLFDQARKQ